MNDFMGTLSRALARVAPGEREEILSDYREHFEIGLSQGLTEGQIAQKLGDPVSIAKLYTVKTAAAQAERTKHPKDAFAMVGAAYAYRMGKGMAVGTLYFLFVLAMLPVFALGGALVLGAAGGVFLAVFEFAKNFVAYGLLAVFAAVMLLAMGVLCLTGARWLWSLVIGKLSRWAGRAPGSGKREEESE